MQVQDNTPSPGYISWSDVHISYKGQTYSIADGNTDLIYIYWKYSDPTSFYGSDTFPILGDDDILVFLNKNGTHVTVPNATVIDGSLIVPESILTNALSANAVTSEKIAAGAVTAATIAADAVGAEAIAAGAITADHIASSTITGDKLVADTITAREIASKTITANEIASNTITASSGIIANAAITNAMIADATITSAKISSIDASKIKTGTLSAITIDGVTITGSYFTSSSGPMPSPPSIGDSSQDMTLDNGGISFTKDIHVSDGLYPTLTVSTQIDADSISITGSHPEHMFGMGISESGMWVRHNYSYYFGGISLGVDYFNSRTNILSTNLAKLFIGASKGDSTTDQPDTGDYTGIVPIEIDTDNTMLLRNVTSLTLKASSFSSNGLGLNMNNSDLYNVNHITIADSGGSEGIEWLGGNGWKIVESPDDGSNTSGNLQVFQNGARAFTINTNHNAYVTGDSYVIQGTGGTGYFRTDRDYLQLKNGKGTVFALSQDASGNFIQSQAAYDRTYPYAVNCFISSTGVIGRSTSASKYKINIQEAELNNVYNILKLQPKKWFHKPHIEAYADLLTREANGEIIDWDNEMTDLFLEAVHGFIAEEVSELGFEQFVQYGQADENGNREIEGIMYDRLWIPLLEVVKDLTQRVSALEAKIGA